MKRFIFLLSGLLVFGVVFNAHAADIDEGIEYQLVSPPVRTENDTKIEIVELFWYGCPHCYQFEPKLDKWKKNLPANVEFVRIPAVFAKRPSWELHARAYYTAEFLGVLDKTHGPLFDAIHKRNEKLFTKQALANFFARYGVDKKEFLETLYSFGVSMKVDRAIDLTNRYGINGVPTVIVNGRYRTHASLTNGQAGMLKVMDFLISKEAAEKK